MWERELTKGRFGYKSRRKNIGKCVNQKRSHRVQIKTHTTKPWSFTLCPLEFSRMRLGTIRRNSPKLIPQITCCFFFSSLWCLTLSVKRRHCPPMCWGCYFEWERLSFPSSFILFCGTPWDTCHRVCHGHYGFKVRAICLLLSKLLVETWLSYFCVCHLPFAALGARQHVLVFSLRGGIGIGVFWMAWFPLHASDEEPALSHCFPIKKIAPTQFHEIIRMSGH